MLVTWVGLALAYFYDYPVGFYITTLAFAVYVARAAPALLDRPAPPARRSAAAARA